MRVKLFKFSDYLPLNKNIEIFKASLLLNLSVFFQRFFKNIFVISLFSFHIDKIGRIITRPLAVTISIFYGNPVESGIQTVFEGITVP